MIIDVGCGHNPIGDVNVDLFVEATPHRSGDQSKCDDKRLDTKGIPNFVMADACHLPFKDNVFNVVFSSHTIEHVNDPFLMLKEMARISKRRIIIKCPHRFASHRIKPLHVNRLNITWFENAAKKIRLTVISKKVSSWRSIPHSYIPIVSFPQEITMVFVKSIQK
jgi:ubiquinone/menaquinone biosynthesis C-methylase UbiE